MENYRPRLADKTLERKLKGKGAVLIQGPKWCGKTTTAEQMAKSILYMSMLEDVKSNFLQMDLARASLAAIRVLRTFIDSIAKNLHELQICLRFYFFSKKLDIQAIN